MEFLVAMTTLGNTKEHKSFDRIGSKQNIWKSNLILLL